MENSQAGIVYVLTNPALSWIVKIGKTSRDSVDARLSELYSTGVPVPFECEFSERIADENQVERALHMAFGHYCVNQKREFFEIEPTQAIAPLELMVTENMTPLIQLEADAVDSLAKEDSKKFKARRPVQIYLEMGIPLGSMLEFTNK